MSTNKIIKRISGITHYYFPKHMSNYKELDFLQLVPDFDNPYDHNALAIYDFQNNKLGYVEKESNVYIYDIISKYDYCCYISSIFQSASTPSIEYTIEYSINSSYSSTDANFKKNLINYNKLKFEDGITNDYVDYIIKNDCLIKYTGNNSTVKIPNFVSRIDNNAFRNNDSVKQIFIPSNIKSIGNYAFYSCKNLNIIKMENGVLSIESHAFANCPKLCHAELADTIVVIGENAFEKCTNLKYLSIPSHIYKIESGAFIGCDDISLDFNLKINISQEKFLLVNKLLRFIFDENQQYFNKLFESNIADNNDCEDDPEEYPEPYPEPYCDDFSWYDYCGESMDDFYDHEPD